MRIRYRRNGKPQSYDSEYLQTLPRSSPQPLLSFLTLCPDRWEESSYTALCGTGGQAMHWVLKQAPQIHDVFLCLDNDKPGKAAVRRLAAEAQRAGYSPHELLPDCKDWNDELLSGRL